MRLCLAVAAVAATCFFVPAPQASVDESAIILPALAEIGWKTEVKELSFGKAVIVGDDKTPTYVYLFDKKGSGYERDLLISPVIVKANRISESLFSPSDQFRGYKDFADVAQSLALPAEAGILSPGLPHPAKPRKLTPPEGELLITAIRKQQALNRTFFDAKGASVEGLPASTVMLDGWAMGDFYTLKLKNAKYATVAASPLIVRSRGDAVSVIYSGEEDGVFLPLRSGFDTLKTLCTASKLGPLWNVVEEDAGQAGTWFRQSLAKAAASELWWPSQTAEIIGKLEASAPVMRGLVFARKGDTAVAFFYTEEGEPQVIEMADGEVRATLDLGDAATRAETTIERDLWESYEGAMRQFAHPAIVLALYRNEPMRNG